MGKTYRHSNTPDQMVLFPQDVREWLPAGHLAYFISDTVDQLDISRIERVYEGDLRGYPPYHPRMMLKLLIYGYCTGVRSSRKIARKVEEDIAFRVLAGGQFPKFRAIADFRKRHLSVFKELFLQVLRICQASGLTQLGNVALDGTKLKANASKHKAMSYGRMKEEEKRLRKEIDSLVAEAQRLDLEEDRRLGSKRRGDEIPAELQLREERLKRIQAAKQALEEEAKQAKKPPEDNDGSNPPGGSGSGHSASNQPEPVPPDKAQRNFTDPESKIMPYDGTFIQGYNAQAVVDSAHQIIVAHDVVNTSSDKPQLVPMIDQAIKNLCQKPRGVCADAGYFTKPNIEFLRHDRHIAAYIPPNRQRHHGPPAAVRGPISPDMSLADRMRRWLSTKRGREQYALRKVTVEPVFGQIKRCMGFTQFSMRGQEKSRAEWALVCLCHNVLKLYRYGPATV